MTDLAVDIRAVSGGAGAVCRAILDRLPAWFGFPAAVDDYVRTADTHPSILASLGDRDIGITIVNRHSAYAAEVHLMAVDPAYHRRGVGRAMLKHLERSLAAGGTSSCRSRR